MLDQNRCANCHRAIDGAKQKFCPACGQPTPAHRIDWHFLAHEVEHSLLHMDRGILYTLKSLLLRPGHFIRDYIEGRRANHVKPLLLIMLMAAVVVFLSKLVLAGDVMGAAYTRGISEGLQDPGMANVAKIYIGISDWMNRHFAAATLLMLPVEALILKLSFRRFKLSYPEWLVVTTFLTAQTFVLWALSIPLQRQFPMAGAVAVAIGIVYAAISLMQYFRGYAPWKTALRTLAGLFMFMLAQNVILLLIAFGVGVATGVRGG